VPLAKHAERISQSLAGTSRPPCWSTTWTPACTSSTATPPSTPRCRPGTQPARARRVTNAGAVFVGPWTPVSLGDYCAGSNHVLPTGGCACHSSGLSVRSFLRTVQVVTYDEQALRDVAPHVLALADAEDLPSHGDAVRARTQS
jgi:histidinol dehydrogenase